MLFQSALSLLLQFCFLSLASAAPIEAARHGNAWQYGAGGGIVGFIVLILDIIVFMEVLKSNRTVGGKVLWCALVFLFPIGGMIIYYLFSNRTAHSSYEPIV